MQRTQVTRNSQWTLGKQFCFWGFWDIAGGTKKVSVISNGEDLVWTKLWATSSKSALWAEGSLLVITSNQNCILQSRVIKYIFVGETSILYRNALQCICTRPIRMTLYFCFVLLTCLPPAAKPDYTLLCCTVHSVFNYSRLLPDISVPT